MATQYGTASTLTVIMEGPFGNAGSAVKLAQIVLPAANWKGAESPYSQVVETDAVSANSLVELQLSVEQLEGLREKVLAFTAKNDGGVVTVYAIGDKPDADYIIQATITEVTA